MKYANWKRSHDKWTGIVKDIQDDEYPAIHGQCGHCEEFYEEYPVSECGEDCPLLKKKLCVNRANTEERAQYPFWRLALDYKHLTKRSRLHYAKKILAAIMEDEPK